MKIVLRPHHALAPVLAIGVWAAWPREPVVSSPPPRSPAHEAAAQEMKARAAAVAAVLLGRPAEVGAEPPPAGWTPAFGLRLGRIARIGVAAPPVGFRDDCSGFASWVSSTGGVPMDGTVRSIFELALLNGALHWEPIPRVGDLIFFDDTHDRNENGQWDDDLTHIAVVIDVSPDGTARFAHGGTGVGRTYGTINLFQPSTHEDDAGNPLNSYLRSPEPWDPPEAAYLAGDLWTAFATVDPTLDWLGGAG